MLQTRVSVDHKDLSVFCREHGVVKLSLFGSILRNDFDSEHSDVDVLVEFAPEAHKSLFKLGGMQRTLSRMFGREVDLTTVGSLSRYFRDDILANAVVLYDAA